MKTLRNESGNVVLIAMLIASLAGIGFITSLLMQQRKGQKDVTTHLTIQSLVNNVMNTLENDASFKAVIAANPNLSCLSSNGASCDPSQFGPIDIVLANGSLLAGKAANFGFDEKGITCNTFNPAGSKSCMYRLEISWGCFGGACAPTKIDANTGIPLDPKIQISGVLKYAPDDDEKKRRVKVGDYDFAFIRANRKDSISAACKSFGAYFDQTTNKCKILRGSGVCPEKHHMTGIDASGNQICVQSPMIDVTCPDRNAVVGVGMRGGLKCYLF